MVGSGIEAATAFVPTTESSTASLLPLLIAVYFLLLQILPRDIWKSIQRATTAGFAKPTQIISLLAIHMYSFSYSHKNMFLQTQLVHIW